MVGAYDRTSSGVRCKLQPGDEFDTGHGRGGHGGRRFCSRRMDRGAWRTAAVTVVCTCPGTQCPVGMTAARALTLGSDAIDKQKLVNGFTAVVVQLRSLSRRERTGGGPHTARKNSRSCKRALHRAENR